MSDFYELGDLHVGMRINVEGTLQADGALAAHMISIKDDGDADEIAATIEDVDTAAGTLRILGFTVHVDDELEIKDLDKSLLSIEALRPGMRIKMKGLALEGRRFEPEKIKVRVHSPDEMDEVEGAITALDLQARRLTVLGLAITCGADVEIEA